MTQSNDPRNLLHRSKIVVRWRDMDALGHVNNAEYFTYCEQIRIEWMDAIGLGDHLGGKLSTGPVIVNASMTFHAPVHYPASLEIRLLGGAPGRSSVELHYELRDQERPESLYASGTSKLVWVDYGQGRSAPLPEAIRALLPTD